MSLDVLPHIQENSGRSRRAPHMPTKRVMGHLHDFRADILGFFTRARLEHGPVVRVRLGPVPYYLVNNPEAIERVLVENHKNYSKQTRGYDVLRLFIGNGLVTSEGAFWLRQRRIAQPSFHKKRIEELSRVMGNAATHLADSLAPKADDPNTTVDMAEQMANVTLRIAGETLFSYDLSDQSSDLGKSVSGLMTYFSALFTSAMPLSLLALAPVSFRGRRHLGRMLQVVEEIIAERRAHGSESVDLLSMLMDATDAETGESMSDLQLRDEVMTMLMAGHETTSNAVSWTLYALSEHPEIADRMADEIKNVLDGRELTGATAMELTYCRQVLSESLRLYPPVWGIARKAIDADVLAGYAIPKGAYVVMSNFVVQRDPELWPNPLRFDPERFAPDAPKPSRGAYFPFSMGQRKCIGDHFSITESLILLATLVSRYRMTVVKGHPVEIDPSATSRVRYGLPMHLTSREK